MPKLLDGYIAKQVAKGLKAAGMTKPATLIKVTAGTRTPGAISAGTNPTETSFKCRGLVQRATLSKIGGTLVEKGDRVIVLLGATIAGKQVPTSKDKITIEGVTSRIIAVDRDPASAAYTCLTRT